MQFRLNNDQTSAVKSRRGLGGATGWRSSVHPGSLCLAGKRIELLAPGRPGAVSAPQKGCNLWGAAVSIRVQGGMQNAETGHGTVGGRAAEIRGEEAKTPEILRRTIEEPSKNHRRSFVTSRLHHPYHTPASRLQHAMLPLGPRQGQGPHKGFRPKMRVVEAAGGTRNPQPCKAEVASRRSQAAF